MSTLNWQGCVGSGTTYSVREFIKRHTLPAVVRVVQQDSSKHGSSFDGAKDDFGSSSDKILLLVRGGNDCKRLIAQCVKFRKNSSLGGSGTNALYSLSETICRRAIGSSQSPLFSIPVGSDVNNSSEDQNSNGFNGYFEILSEGGARSGIIKHSLIDSVSSLDVILRAHVTKNKGKVASLFPNQLIEPSMKRGSNRSLNRAEGQIPTSSMQHSTNIPKLKFLVRQDMKSYIQLKDDEEDDIYEEIILKIGDVIIPEGRVKLSISGEHESGNATTGTGAGGVVSGMFTSILNSWKPNSSKSNDNKMITSQVVETDTWNSRRTSNSLQTDSNISSTSSSSSCGSSTRSNNSSSEGSVNSNHRNQYIKSVVDKSSSQLSSKTSSTNPSTTSSSSKNNQQQTKALQDLKNNQLPSSSFSNNTSQSKMYLKCTLISEQQHSDQNPTMVFIPFETSNVRTHHQLFTSAKSSFSDVASNDCTSKFSIIASSQNISGVHHITNLANSKQHPLMVKMVCGTKPIESIVYPCNLFNECESIDDVHQDQDNIKHKPSNHFTPEIRILGRDEGLLTNTFAIALNDDETTIFPLASIPSRDMKVQPISNQEELRETPGFQTLAGKATQLVDYANKFMTVIHRSNQNSASSTNNTTNMIKEINIFGFRKQIFDGKQKPSTGTETSTRAFSKKDSGFHSLHDLSTSKWSKRQMTLDNQYDEIDQIYDYVRGMAPLPTPQKDNNYSTYMESKNANLRRTISAGLQLQQNCRQRVSSSPITDDINKILLNEKRAAFRNVEDIICDFESCLNEKSSLTGIVNFEESSSIEDHSSLLSFDEEDFDEFETNKTPQNRNPTSYQYQGQGNRGNGGLKSAVTVNNKPSYNRSISHNFLNNVAASNPNPSALKIGPSLLISHSKTFLNARNWKNRAAVGRNGCSPFKI